MLLAPLLLAACQDPFAEDRHDLASFRIAAVRADYAGADATDVRVFVYSGVGMWHPAPPEVTWTAGGHTVTGPLARLPIGAPVDIELTATDGTSTETATISYATPSTPPRVQGWSRGTVPLTIADVVTPIEARAEAVVGADGPVEPGGGLRLAVQTDDASTTHWMATGGQFAELDAHTTDWFAGTAELDNDELVSTTDLGEGVQSLVALTFDGEGGNTWEYIDAVVGGSGPRLLVGGRVFPVDATPGAGLWAFTAEATEDLAGVRLTDLARVDDPSTAEAACGSPAGAVFDLAALPEGRCGREDVVGARLVVQGEVVP